MAVVDGYICERQFIVAEYGGVIVGFGFLADLIGTLEALSVEPNFARRGVGTAAPGAVRSDGIPSCTSEHRSRRPFGFDARAAAAHARSGQMETERGQTNHPNREKQLLFDLERCGRTYGLSRKQARDFMVAQMEAGKLVQETDFAAHLREGAFVLLQDFRHRRR